MRRREFITVVGGAAAAWPRAGRAQQPEQVRRIGVLMSHLESDPEAQAWYAAFRKELQKLGWTEGRNIRIDARWSTSDAVGGTRREEMAISLSVLSVACFIGAAISFLRYDSKYFDLLVLSGVIFIGTAMPSFEVDASLEELKSINHNLVSLPTAIEDLQRK